MCLARSLASGLIQVEVLLGVLARVLSRVLPVVLRVSLRILCMTLARTLGETLGEPLDFKRDSLLDPLQDWFFPRRIQHGVWRVWDILEFMKIIVSWFGNFIKRAGIIIEFVINPENIWKNLFLIYYSQEPDCILQFLTIFYFLIKCRVCKKK